MSIDPVFPHFDDQSFFVTADTETEPDPDFLASLLGPESVVSAPPPLTTFDAHVQAIPSSQSSLFMRREDVVVVDVEPTVEVPRHVVAMPPPVVKIETCPTPHRSARGATPRRRRGRGRAAMDAQMLEGLPPYVLPVSNSWSYS